jgi:archaellum component FlaG (FlaF/FlaG flagellin family)
MGEEISNITDIKGLAKSGNATIPFPNSEIKVFIEGSWLNITTTTDMSAYTATVRIYYED